MDGSLFRILYQDDHYVAVYKPAGLLVHRSDIDRQARQFALQMTRDLVGRYVYPVHRLDKPTAGALVFGLTPEAARLLSEAFARRAVQKTYLTGVRGYAPSRGVVDAPLREHPDKVNRGSRHDERKKQRAVTVFRRLATVELPYPVGRYPTARYSLLAVRPRTGRMHQIRRHMNRIAHPIIGDGKHGDYRHNRFFREHLGCSRLLLSAVQLSFRHPYSREAVSIPAPLDQELFAVFEGFGWGDAVPPCWRPSTLPRSYGDVDL